MRSARQNAAMIGANVDGTRERDDFYPTPPDLVWALLSVERFDAPIWEPACGDGSLSRVLEVAGHRVFSSDLVDRGFGEPRRDFLWEGMPEGCRHIITNPPFKLGEQFWDRACSLATGKVAFLCRLTWLESLQRAKLFERWPLARVWVIPWRPKFQRGRLATEDDGAGMTGYAWYVHDKAHAGPANLQWVRRQ